MMAIADIYDALTAQDRPYKKSVPLDKVIIILKKRRRETSLILILSISSLNTKLYERIPAVVQSI
jgi:hypothetical protein